MMTASKENTPSIDEGLIKPRKILGVRLSALLESLAFLSLFVIFNYWLDDGTRLVNTPLHPFWVIILLVTVQYGTIEGLVAAFLATLFLYVGNIPPQKTSQTLFEYQQGLALVPTLWFIAAFVLGELRMRQEYEKLSLQKDLAATRAAVRTITQSYEDLRAVKESLEVTLAGQLKTSAMTYKTFKALGTLNPALILLNLEKVILPILNPKKFSVYSIGSNGLEPAINYGWGKNEPYIRRFPTDTLLYREIIGRQHMLCIINPDDEKILAGEGILAAPLIDPESGEIFGMLKIEEVNFLELNISNLEIFKTLCELVGIAYSNARHHQKVESNTLYSFTDILLSYSFYRIQIAYLKKLAELVGIPLTTLTIQEQSIESELEEGLLYLLLKETLPNTAQVFRGKRRSGELFVLLPGRTTEEAKSFPPLILHALQHNDILSSKSLSFTITPIYVPPSKEAPPKTER